MIGSFIKRVLWKINKIASTIVITCRHRSQGLGLLGLNSSLMMVK